MKVIAGGVLWVFEFLRPEGQQYFAGLGIVFLGEIVYNQLTIFVSDHFIMDTGRVSFLLLY